MEGLTQGGLFGWAKMPGGAERICEETTNIEESEFADLLMPLVQLSQPTEEGDLSAPTANAHAVPTHEGTEPQLDIKEWRQGLHSPLRGARSLNKGSWGQRVKDSLSKVELGHSDIRSIHVTIHKDGEYYDATLDMADLYKIGLTTEQIITAIQTHAH